MLFSDLIEAEIVKTTLIIINIVAVAAVKRDNKFAEPLADIIPAKPPPPPPKPRPSLSVPCTKYLVGAWFCVLLLAADSYFLEVLPLLFGPSRS